jgi:hypothetical protein
MSEDPIMENGEVTDKETDTEEEKTPSELLKTPIIYTTEKESQIEYTGWADSYKDDDEQAVYYLSLVAEAEEKEKSFALFFNKDFRPYFNEAVEKYLKEKGVEE